MRSGILAFATTISYEIFWEESASHQAAAGAVAAAEARAEAEAGVAAEAGVGVWAAAAAGVEILFVDLLNQ